MNRKIQVILLGIGLIALLAIAIFVLSFWHKKSDIPELVGAMLQESNCVSPCFFGESLQGKSVEEVNNILSNNEFMKGIELEYENKGNEQYISWRWPDSIRQQLTSDGLNMDQFFQYRSDDINYVGFRDGILTDMNIIFLIHLDELIETRGDPTLMSVGIYRSEAAALALVYNDPSTYFTADLYCSHPQLTPDTQIWAYSFSSPPYDLTANYTIAWSGYNNPELACKFPPP